MTTGPHAVGISLVAGLCLCAVAAPVAQRSSRERSMYVSVVDQNGAPVPNVGPSDLLVKEDNVTREVLRVSPAEDPMQVAVLVDTSIAARDDIQHMRQALPPFVEELTIPNAAGRRNEVAIIGIGERPTILAEYSTDPTQVKKGIDRIWPLPNSGMYLLDAIIETAQGFKKREAQRPVIISIATSGQDFSNRQHDQAIEPLKDIGAAYYALMLGQPDTGLSPESRERAIVLDEGPRVSGGYQEQLLTSMALAPKLKVLANQLTHQYKITYGRPESLIPPEKITVAAVKPGQTARGTPIKEAQVRP
jgi:von Willebrand factor type A domain